MGSTYKKKLKELLGHADFGPVLSNDVLDVTSTVANTIAGHTVAYTWVAPRTVSIDGIIVQSTGNVVANRINWTLQAGTTVVASGDLPVGTRSEARFVVDERALASVSASGTLITVAYAVPASIGTAQSVRFAVPVTYIGAR